MHYDHQDTIDSFDGDISACTRFFALTITLNTAPGEEVTYSSSRGGPLLFDNRGLGAGESTVRSFSGPVSWRASCATDTNFILVNFNIDVHFSVGDGSTFN